MNRFFNFSAGPSMLPEWVLHRAQAELMEFPGTGQSVMEMSHRSKEYQTILATTQRRMREALQIPENYQILFLQGGASTQFAMVPLNLMTKHRKADYVNTGQWSKKAIEEASRYGDVAVVASSEDQNFTYIPAVDRSQLRKDADYLHITWNNTIYGTRYSEVPDVGDVPIAADISSSMLSEPMDISLFGVLYAGAQKNIGIAGLTVVIIREDLIGAPLEGTPTMLQYQVHAKNDSLYNTPPTYAIYLCGLMLEWVQTQVGGLEELHALSQKKASTLYDFLDRSKLFRGTVKKEARSMMNVPFVTGDEELDRTFVKEAAAQGLINLKGHRTIGGMRASLYNGMPIEGVKKLVQFMEQFEQKMGDRRRYVSN